MFKEKMAAIIVAAGLFVVSTGFAESLDENWNDLLHYTKIGRLDLAKGYAQAIIDSNPDPVELLALSKENPEGYSILLRVTEAAEDAELAELAGKVLVIIEQGRFSRRAAPKIIVEEIKRLSSKTPRARFMAVNRLREAGEYAVPYMLDAIADGSRQEELPYIDRALSQLGRDSIRPLVVALQTENVAVKSEIIKALGEIGYPQSLPYLKYIVEKDESAKLRNLAKESIRQIDPAAIAYSSADLFYRLGEKYYYHTESLTPAEDADFANIWFWDADSQQLAWERVYKSYFYELMAMRCCEWALKADIGFGEAIGLWLAAYFKAESTSSRMPKYFGDSYPEAIVYATIAGPEYLQQALARAVRDKDAYVALGAIEALATTAGEKSLLYRLDISGPLVQALSFNERVVRYSAAIAIATAGPQERFAESRLVAEILGEAIAQDSSRVIRTGLWNEQLANSYAIRAGEAMLKLAETRNRVISLSAAQVALINAINDKRPEIQVLAGKILAHLASPDAQRAIAAMGLNSTNNLDVRISAFNSLTTSAKLNANMLIEQMVDHIYALISSGETDPALRSAAASAYGALNLPSRKVKDLILDQARD